MTEREFTAWSAGFFDGEGCVLIQGLSSGSLRLGIAVAQKVRTPLDLMAQRWGGTVRMSHESRSNRHADKFDWRLHGRQAVAFLEDIRPFLVVKAAQADIGLAYGATLPPPGGPIRLMARGVPPDIASHRLTLQLDLRRLNRRGRQVA